MSHDNFLVAEDRIEKTLVQCENVSLLKIPPPHGPDDTDISEWDLNEIVWTGKLKFIQTEFIMSMNVSDVEREIIQGNVLLSNKVNGVFGNIPYTLDGHNIKVTQSKTIYKVIMEHKDKKIAFGLIFKDRSKADEFNISLQHYRKDAKAALETHEDFVYELEEGVKNLKIETEYPRSRDAASQHDGDEKISGTNPHVPTPVPEEDEDEDDEDDFGEFVSGD